MNENELQKLREQLLNTEALHKESLEIYLQDFQSLRNLEVQAKHGEFPSFAPFLDSIQDMPQNQPDAYLKSIPFRFSAFHSMVVKMIVENNRRLLEYVDSLYGTHQ